MFLPGLAVVFAGITGQADHRVEHQLRALTSELHVVAAKVSAADLAVIGHHGEGARDIVQRLHSDGVIAGELITNGGHATVRLIIYSADGGVRSLSETPLAARVLSRDDLSTIRSNLTDELGDMQPAEREPEPPSLPVKAPVAAAIAPRKAAPKVEEVAAVAPDPSSDAPAAAPASSDGSSDTVNVAELEALTAGTDSDATVDAAATPAASLAADDDLHLRAALGLGVGARSFSGPSTVPGYASSAVGIAQFTASIQPTPRITLAGLAERTLEMATPVDNQMADTSVSRWELAAAYSLTRGTIEVMPELGLGHRGFSIDSTSPTSSPSTDYSYAVLGTAARIHLGTLATIGAHLAFEPVFGGADPMAMTFGSATRWAFDGGAALELRPWKHVFARVAADYQRFAWTWNQGGARGAGGAIDGYPSGTVSLGADY